MLAELRYAVRSFFAHPAFALVSILTLALGIGANTAIFSIVDAVLFRAVPFADPDRLVMVWETDRDTGTIREPASVPDFLDIEERAASLAQSAAFMAMELNLAPGSGDPRRVPVLSVSHRLLPMLGLSPLFGRSFTESEDRPGAGDRALISESLWEREFARDPQVVGRTLRLDDRPATVIGVMPRGADFGVLQILSAAAYSRSFADRGERTEIEVWVPLRANPKEFPRSTHPIFVAGRLAPAVSVRDAQAELTRIMSDLERAFPENAARGAHVEPLSAVVFGPIRPAFLLLLAAVATVLIVASVNVACLLLARGTTRAHEIAVRAALGAGRGRLVRLFLAESLALVIPSTILGIGVAFGAVSAIVALAPADIPRVNLAAVDLRVLAVTTLVSAAVAVVFGLFPMIQVGPSDLQSALKDQAARVSAGLRRRRIQQGLVVAELALAALLACGSILLVRSFAQVRQIDPGFRPAGVLKAEYQLPLSRYPRDFRRWPDFPEHHAFMRTLLERAAALPGVESVAIAGNHPLDPGYTNSFVIIGREAEAKTWPEISTRAVTPGYFQTVGLPLLSGRLLRDSDGTTSAPVVLINEAAARQFFPGRSPLGAQLRYWGMTRTIVGVIGNERFQGLTEPGPIAVYTPLAQAPSSTGVLLIRTSLDPSALAGAAERVIHGIDPALAVFALEPLDATVSRSISQRRFTMVLLGGFAALALLLAAVGIHGLFSYAVANRRREIGIRVALGASRAAVLGLFLRDSLVLIAAGLGGGLAGAIALGRVLRGLLFGVTPSDPVTYLIVVFALAGVAVVATLAPARRAARVDPLLALRSE